MPGKSKIEWCSDTWNPATGCTKVSAGCHWCYAEREWTRLSNVRGVYAGRKFTDVKTHPERLSQPLKWQKPRMIFVNSMSDLFHPDISFDFIAAVFAVMAHSPRHKFQVLTKRPERAIEFFAWVEGATIAPLMKCLLCLQKINPAACDKTHSADVQITWPLPNVWLGVSAENQETADDRIRKLHRLRDHAAITWVSFEPLIGPIDPLGLIIQRGPGGRSGEIGPVEHGGLVSWVVVGGESGPNARPMEKSWVRLLIEACHEGCVPFFFKQGSRANWRHAKNWLVQDKVFQVREYPEYPKIPEF